MKNEKQLKKELIVLAEKMFKMWGELLPIIQKDKQTLFEQCMVKNIETEFEELSKELELLNTSFEQLKGIKKDLSKCK